MAWLLRQLRLLTIDSWKVIDAEAAVLRARRAAQGAGWDHRPMAAFLSGGVFLVLMEYWGMQDSVWQLAGWLAELEQEGRIEGDTFRAFSAARWDHPYASLIGHAWWAGWRVLGFFVLPLLVIRATGERIRDQHLAKPQANGDWSMAEPTPTQSPLQSPAPQSPAPQSSPQSLARFYALGLAVAVVILVVVSFSPSFQHTYPFYELASRSVSDLLIWELMYAAQFFSLEFFFRGWWLRAGRTLGSHAIWAMTVPYVMIHFSKPMAETMGAIVAGVFLGTLAMRGKSIWPGVALHCIVAIGMDLACLLQKDGMPTQWWP